MIQKLKNEKAIIDNFLQNYLEQQKQNFAKQSLVEDAFNKLTEFAKSGKTVRGGLFLLATKTLKPDLYQEKQEDLLKIASALELIHSSLLIHDDIIDHDKKRRGSDSIWHQYQKDAAKNKFNDDQNYGESQAICLGNIANYLANLLLEDLVFLSEETKQTIKKTIAQEIIKTNFAEMLDSKITSQTTLPKIDEVLEMYLYKTARYTFSLPLKLALIVCRYSVKEQKQVEEISEKFGLIFQIIDDQISLFTDEQTSGKSFVSDIKEGKKTIFYLYFMKNAPDKEQETMNKYFGNKQLGHEEIAIAQKLFRENSLINVEELTQTLNKESLELINKIENKTLAELLNEVLEFNLNRKS